MEMARSTDMHFGGSGRRREVTARRSGWAQGQPQLAIDSGNRIFTTGRRRYVAVMPLLICTNRGLMILTMLHDGSVDEVRYLR